MFLKGIPERDLHRRCSAAPPDADQAAEGDESAEPEAPGLPEAAAPADLDDVLRSRCGLGCSWAAPSALAETLNLHHRPFQGKSCLSEAGGIDYRRNPNWGQMFGSAPESLDKQCTSLPPPAILQDHAQINVALHSGPPLTTLVIAVLRTHEAFSISWGSFLWVS